MACLYPKDPLIMELKGYTSKFLECYKKGDPVTDAHPLLLSLEGCLENIFYCSIKAQTALFGYLWDGSAWRWIEKTMKSDDFYNENYQITQVIESVKQRKDVLTQDGRFRLAVRYCLVRKCLHRPIEYLRSSDKCDKYYVSDAILADEILIEILLSVIYQLNIVDFKLDLENSAFLDLSWELPRIINVDLVPSKDLGISVKYAGERPIITKIRANSVVHESADINIGDVIECINNVPVLSVAHGSLNTLLKTSRIQPVTLRLIKAITDPTKNTIHPAMIQLYKEIQLDPETVRASLNRNHNTTQGSTWRQCNLKLKAFGNTFAGLVSQLLTWDACVWGAIMRLKQLTRYSPTFSGRPAHRSNVTRV